MLKLLNKLLGDPNDKEIKRLQTFVQEVNAAEEKLQSLSDEDLKAKTQEFQSALENGKTLEDIKVEAFAVVKNACRRLCGKKFPVGDQELEWNMVPFDVQILGGAVLHEGKIAEMKTGEGKTLVAVMPVYLNALQRKGVHVITVNDYLAKRDAQWMGNLYQFLGLTVGCVVHGLSPAERKEAYGADITYGTNNEFGFDYLRDNMATKPENIVQRDLQYVIVDEVDSILIDEARTPLIISAPAEESTEKYQQYAMLVKQLQENTHYNLDEKQRTAVLTEEGVHKMEQLLGVENIYTEKGFVEVHHIEQALRSQFVFNRDTDYVVKDGEVIIVDEFTGRLMPGRRYSDGLHQAIEAKENVTIKRQSKTLASITFQNYFRLYHKLAGMTGTAITEAEEFLKIYGLDVIVIPTNRPIARQDKGDVVYKNVHGKFQAIANVVKEKNEKGQPVLIGTVSIEKSEALSATLQRAGIPHSVLNAKHHEQEATIVADAGQRGAVTIATNMAGRGTDIKLGEEVKELGGLCIIGSERHESRRIDNQLRGRAGRQGDPGETQFFISLEDSLMRLFGSERLQKMMNFMKVPDDMPIETRMISGAIENAQKKVEGRNFDIRKHVVQYDDVMNKHREIIYERRRKILFHEDLHGEILEMLLQEVTAIVENNTADRKPHEWNLKEIAETTSAIYHSEDRKIEVGQLEQMTDPDEIKVSIHEFLLSVYKQREQSLPTPQIMREVERAVYLRTIDTLWMEHIDAMTYLRQNVALRGYGQRDPLMEYKDEAFRMFQALLGKIAFGTITTLFKINIETRQQPVIRSETPKKMMTNEAAIEQGIQNGGLGMEGIRSPQSGVGRKGQNAVLPQTPDSKLKTSPAQSSQNAASSNSSSPITVINADDPVPQNAVYSSGSSAQRVVKTTGTIRNDEKVGRNDPCPCGNGKKYKKCCGKY